MGAGSVFPGKIVSAVVAALLVLVWLVRDYRFRGRKSAAAANAGHLFELKSRFDAHGIEQVWVPPDASSAARPLEDRA
jgi:hypothetical protein